MDDEVKGNLKNADVWMRLLYIVIFYLFYGAAKVVLFVMVVYQFLSTLFTGKTNERLLDFGRQLSEYIYQTVKFLSYTSDDKPFPFADWPSGGKEKPAAKTAAVPKKKAVKKRAPKAKAKTEPEPQPKSEPEGGEEKES
jgi:hypothetical protein